MPDPNAAPLNLTQLFQLANLLVSSEIRGSYIPYLLQSTEPAVDDRDKAWIVLDSAGRPIAIKTFYNGLWRRVYNGMIGEIRGFNGNPTNHFNDDGKGNPGGEYDGWHICNGKDGTPDLSDRFIVGAHMNNLNGQTGWSSTQGQWRTFVDGKTILHTGGAKDITLTDKNTFQPGAVIGEVTVGRYIITPGGGETLDEDGVLWGKKSAGDETKNTTINVISDGNTTPDPIPTLPPFVAFALIIFVGY
jgi:hypothetical protein